MEEWQKDSQGNWGAVGEACECPNCENGGECLRGFCSECLEELEDSNAAEWGVKCDSCLGNAGELFTTCENCGEMTVEIDSEGMAGDYCETCTAGFDPCTRCGDVAPLDGEGHCIDCIRAAERELTLASLQVLNKAAATLDAADRASARVILDRIAAELGLA